MCSAQDLLLLHHSFFFLWRGWARPRCCFGDPLTWQGQQGQPLNSYRSGLRRPVSSSDRCRVWLSKRLKLLACPRLVFVEWLESRFTTHNVCEVLAWRPTKTSWNFQQCKTPCASLSCLPTLSSRSVLWKAQSCSAAAVRLVKEVRSSFNEFSKPKRFCSYLVETFFKPFPFRTCKKKLGVSVMVVKIRWLNYPWLHAHFRSDFFLVTLLVGREWSCECAETSGKTLQCRAVWLTTLTATAQKL